MKEIKNYFEKLMVLAFRMDHLDFEPKSTNFREHFKDTNTDHLKEELGFQENAGILSVEEKLISMVEQYLRINSKMPINAPIHTVLQESIQINDGVGLNFDLKIRFDESQWQKIIVVSGLRWIDHEGNTSSLETPKAFRRIQIEK